MDEPRKAKRGVLQLLFAASVFLSAGAASSLILKFASAPFLWLWLTWAAALWAAIPGIQGSWHRAILFNLGIVAIMMAGAEAYFAAHQDCLARFSGRFSELDDVLGWAPPKGVQLHAIKLRRAGLRRGPTGPAYDVTYSIDSNGLRVAPPYREDDLAGTILFFGCSFTFGEGLNDQETLPYQTGLQSGGRYRTMNFGFSAYGPEQMLAAIEQGMVGRVVDSAPQYAFYSAIPDHVWRVAGRALTRHRPRYVLDADGGARRAGYWNVENPITSALRGRFNVVADQLDKSAMWRFFTTHESRVTGDDIRLYFAVVRRSQQLLAAEYPGLQFHVILWPALPNSGAQQRSVYEQLRDGFRRMGFPLDLAEDILPGYDADPEKYELSSDGHPNALANRLLAQHILSETGAQPLPDRRAR